jgi:hypothetical protein
VSVKIAAKMDDNPSFREEFQQAKGESEFYSDGTFVHILNADGTREWREAKLAAFAKHVPCASALPSEWASRELSKPTVVYAFAAIENKEAFQERCQIERRRLGIGGVTSALGDGALWIWNVVKNVFGKTDECLDIFHALEHISSCGKVLYGSGQDFTDWLERMRMVLLSEGFSGMERELVALKIGLRVEQCKLVDSLLEYLRNNSGRLNYCERLASGRVIGSGLIEGACKNLIGHRLKQTGASWRVERANKMAFICALLYAEQWKNAWKNTT